MKINTINVVEVMDNSPRQPTIIITAFSDDLEGQEQAEALFIELAVATGYVEGDWRTWDYDNREGYHVFLRLSDYAPDNARTSSSNPNSM